MSDKLNPTPSEETKYFWEKCNEGKFVAQQCLDCGGDRFYPSEVCPKCWSFEWKELEIEGEGTIESFTVVHRAPSEELKTEVPYIIAIVSFHKSIKVMANILADPADVSIGDPVEITWEERGGQFIYQFCLN